MKYKLRDVTSDHELWENGDPVRPELDVAFKTVPGRRVHGLQKSDGTYVAFCCTAKTTAVPRSAWELDALTSTTGQVIIPYTVWSLERGAGRMILKEILAKVGETGQAKRVVTLSPPTEMARRFHLRNGAREISVNKDTVNFEYEIPTGDDQ